VIIILVSLICGTVCKLHIVLPYHSVSYCSACRVVRELFAVATDMLFFGLLYGVLCNINQFAYSLLCDCQVVQL